jgi:hypothetical protein
VNVLLNRSIRIASMLAPLLHPASAGKCGTF